MTKKNYNKILQWFWFKFHNCCNSFRYSI